MFAEQITPTRGGMSGWSDALGELHERIARRFARAEVRERVRRYLVGLLGRVERKNGWQLAEAIGEVSPRGVQRLLNSATWDADGVRDDLRTYVVDHLGDATTGVLVLDDTGFVKKGDKSYGVARQYTGTLGETVNAQVGVFLAYAWADDIDRRQEAGVPLTIPFAPKIALAQQMLARAWATGVSARSVLADSGYGRSHAFRRWLEEHGHAYALMVPKTHAVWYDGRRQTAVKLVDRLADEVWTEKPISAGAYNVQRQGWACLVLSETCPVGEEHGDRMREDERRLRMAGDAPCPEEARRWVGGTDSGAAVSAMR